MKRLIFALRFYRALGYTWRLAWIKAGESWPR